MASSRFSSSLVSQQDTKATVRVRAKGDNKLLPRTHKATAQVEAAGEAAARGAHAAAAT